MLTSEYNMLRVAGGCSAVKLYNRIRGDRIRGVQKVTLHYLTLLTVLYLAHLLTLLIYLTGPRSKS